MGEKFKLSNGRTCYIPGPGEVVWKGETRRPSELTGDPEFARNSTGKTTEFGALRRSLLETGLQVISEPGRLRRLGHRLLRRYARGPLGPVSARPERGDLDDLLKGSPAGVRAPDASNMTSFNNLLAAHIEAEVYPPDHPAWNLTDDPTLQRVRDEMQLPPPSGPGATQP